MDVSNIYAGEKVRYLALRIDEHRKEASQAGQVGRTVELKSETRDQKGNTCKLIILDVLLLWFCYDKNQKPSELLKKVLLKNTNF